MSIENCYPFNNINLSAARAQAAIEDALSLAASNCGRVKFEVDPNSDFYDYEITRPGEEFSIPVQIPRPNTVLDIIALREREAEYILAIRKLEPTSTDPGLETQSAEVEENKLSPDGFLMVSNEECDIIP